MSYKQSNSSAETGGTNTPLLYLAVLLMVFSPIMLAVSGAMPAILWITVPVSVWAWWYGCSQ